ncbi:hypothetical protein ACROYT_G022143 [Oculina patagonica]
MNIRNSFSNDIHTKARQWKRHLADGVAESVKRDKDLSVNAEISVEGGNLDQTQLCPDLIIDVRSGYYSPKISLSSCISLSFDGSQLIGHFAQY